MGKWLSPGEPLYRAPAFNAAMVATLVLLGGTVASSARADKNGFLAANFDPVASLQQQVGLIAGIDQTVRRVESKVDVANTKLDGIDGKVDVIKDVVTGNAPMSDPRKELSRMGVPWNAASFGDAIRRSDVRVIRLFLDGGMPAHLPDGTSSVPPMANLIPLPENERNALLQLLAQANVPLGTSWRTRIAGTMENVCLPTSCFGMAIHTCATTFPRVALWKRLVELSVKPDKTCLESLGWNLHSLEEAGDKDVERIQILRLWGVQHTERYKDGVSFGKELAAAPAAPAPTSSGVGMKMIDMDSPRNLK
jgi:hypothetical protein